MKRLPILTAIAAAAVLVALAAAPASRDSGKATQAQTPAGPAPATVAQTVLANLDAKADPCADFYRYACGGWLDSTRLPGDQVRWGRGFTEIAERNRLVLKDILESAAKDPGSDPDRRKLGRFYGACMDEEGIEKLGAKPLEPYFVEIEKVKDVASLMTTVGKLHAMGAAPLFNIGALPDFKNPTINIAQIGQGGLGLPDRDYYLKDDERSTGLRTKYEAHVARMLGLAGAKAEDAAAQAKAILAFETALAKASRPREEMRDAEKSYNKIDLAGLKKLAPAMPWDGFLAALGAGGVTQINVATPEYFESLDATLGGADYGTLRAYLRWNLLRAFSPTLPKGFVDAQFEFYGKTLAGQKEQQARWKRCIGATDGALGEILAKSYVERQFAGDSKKIAQQMIDKVEAAFGATLPELAWMDDATRERARGKLAALTNKIGYPDRWRTYDFEVKAGDAFGNSLRSAQFEARRDIAKIGDKVDKLEWFMTPPTVNAYYNPLGNEMVFPAGILQPPFFDRSFPMAMNFGGIGMVMGHELTHGYDDEGRKFAPDGRLVEWWEPQVAEKFEKQAACIENLYDGFEVQPGVKLNGKLTLGENIADFGGIKSAYRAYRTWAKDNASAEPAVKGLTDDQLFFVGFAQTWCSIATPEIERVLATVDPHSPPKFRVNGPLAHLPEFAQAFQCKEGSAMRAASPCSVW